MFWDNAAAEQLLEEKYPWFLDTWRMYPRVVHRGETSCPTTHPRRPEPRRHILWTCDVFQMLLSELSDGNATCCGPDVRCE